MSRSPEMSSNFYGPFFNGCFILNISSLTMITICARIQAEYLKEVLPLNDAYMGEMIGTKPRSKPRYWLRFVAVALLGHLVPVAVALAIHYAFFVK